MNEHVFFAEPLTILTHPHEVLRKKCVPITILDSSVRDLAALMLYTIGPTQDHKRIGVGLAAPQVGHAMRLVVISAPGFPEMAMVNPVITKSKGWEVGPEGCLSLPGERGYLGRYTTIWVTYQDLEGKVCNLKAKDFLARVIQHEVDHLDGIEFTDRIAEQTGGSK